MNKTYIALLLEFESEDIPLKQALFTITVAVIVSAIGGGLFILYNAVASL